MLEFLISLSSNDITSFTSFKFFLISVFIFTFLLFNKSQSLKLTLFTFFALKIDLFPFVILVSTISPISLYKVCSLVLKFLFISVVVV